MSAKIKARLYADFIHYWSHLLHLRDQFFRSNCVKLLTFVLQRENRAFAYTFEAFQRTIRYFTLTGVFCPSRGKWRTFESF